MDRDLAVGITFVVYLLVTLGIGALAWRHTRSLSDYLLGGRRLGPRVAALSAQASDMSGWLLLGLPGYAWSAGLEAGWLALGLLAGTWLNWRFVAERLRRSTEARGDAITLPEFLERRFGGADRVLRVVAAGFILLFFLFYTASGLVAGGKLFNAVFGIPYTWAVAGTVFVIVAYTLLGGFLAVSWTDTLQGVLMLVALVVLPIVAIDALGGAGAARDAVAAVNPALLDPMRGTDGEPLGVLGIVSLLAWGLGYFGQPHILARFMAIRDARRTGTARRIAVAWVCLTLGGALAAGVAGIGLAPPGTFGGDPERIFIHLVNVLLHPVPAGICLAAILAAIMSTADSQLLVASSALAGDLYRGLLRRDATDAGLVRAGRLAVVLIALVALVLALAPGNRVLDLVAYAWAGFGAVFGPVVLGALYWPRMTRNGALAGMLAGGITVVVWHHLQGGLFELYEIVPGIVLAVVAIVVASLAGPVSTGGREERHA